MKLQKNDRANLFNEIKASPAAVSAGENSVIKVRAAARRRCRLGRVGGRVANTTAAVVR